MIGILARIAASVGASVGSTTAGILAAVAVLIAAVSAGIVLVFSALPNMPAVPDAPTGVAWLNWFVPIGPLVGVFSAFVTSYVVFLAVRVLARWVKAA